MNYQRIIAGVFAGVGAIYLIFCGLDRPAIAILSSMMAFFVGEQNGKRSNAKND